LFKLPVIGYMPHTQQSQRAEGSSVAGWEPRSLGNPKCVHSRVRSKNKAALVTLYLSHLPFHPSCLLGYGTAILAGRYDLEVIDLNAEIYFRNSEKLKKILDVMDKSQIVSDALSPILTDTTRQYLGKNILWSM